MTDTNSSKNIILITDLKANDPNLDSYKQYAYSTWRYYAKKYDIQLIILDRPLTDVEVMRPTWQRWYVYDLLKINDISYNWVAMVDIDTMIRWDAPNIFDVVPEEMYGAVKDDLSIEWIYNSIQGYKHLFPDVQTLDWTNYVNNGILVLPKSSGEEFCSRVKDFYHDNINELRELQHKTLKKGTDQTPVNYLMRRFFKEGVIFYMPKTFNLTHIYKTDAIVDDIYIKCSYIWHFNGIPRDKRSEWMKHTWEKIKNNY